jgi:hypothetical protein
MNDDEWADYEHGKKKNNPANEAMISKQQKAQVIYDYVMELPRDDMMDMGIRIGADGAGEAVDEWLDSLDDSEFEKMYQYALKLNDDIDNDINEYRKLAGLTAVEESYYVPGFDSMSGPKETTSISFNQSKHIGDASLNISASAKDMTELHRILKLAGIDYDNGEQAEEPSAPEAPADAPCGCDDMAAAPADVSYSTDKQTLINVLRDKLQQRLK